MKIVRALLLIIVAFGVGWFARERTLESIPSFHAGPMEERVYRMMTENVEGEEAKVRMWRMIENQFPDVVGTARMADVIEDMKDAGSQEEE